MSSFDKVVKLACKPKPAPPKAKYLDPIIAATWSEDGAVHDVCKALVPRLREPNAIIVFKALIVLHIMLRNGATDNILSHLSSSEVLRLRNVSAGNWEGYNAPQNMQHYALYLDSRIRAYRELKHDAIRVQAETNRDLRLNNSLEEDMAYTTAPPSKSSSTKSKVPQRSKTIMGRKLRVMTVEKGLLRETKTVQKMIDSLVECRFYLDDLEDELTITALRMLVKDLLILFQAGNEGVINVLEHYFEMSKYDAEEALSIYRNFCGQTERVVEYLGVARKLQNLLNVPIPNLKHAPVSLASSLQEYLNDPNFEQNRIEYKATKAAADKNPKGSDRSDGPSSQAPGGTSVISTNPVKPPSPPAVNTKPPNVNHVMSDLFDSIEEEQTSIFNPVTNSSTGNPQQMAHNPFVQRQMTGAFVFQPSAGQVQVQPTGFLPSLPFQSAQTFQPFQTLPSTQANSLTVQPQPAPQHRPFSTFIPSQMTGLPSAGFLQPQPTGANPFRQSVLIPQATGIPSFSGNGIVPMPPLPASQTDSLSHITNLQLQSHGQPNQVRQPAHNNSSSEIPARPASTPLTGITAHSASTSPPRIQPVRSHQTGSRNPFGAPVTPDPPMPKPPTLLELSMGFGRPSVDGGHLLPQVQSTTASSTQMQSITASTTEPTLSTVTSSFAFTSKLDDNTSSPTNDPSLIGSLSVNPHFASTTTSGSLFSSFSSQPTNSTISSHASSIPVTGPIKPQATGFGGVKPFKPTSSFGASLLESLPPIPQSSAATPDPTTQVTTQHVAIPSLPTNLSLNGFAASSMSKDDNVLGSINSQLAEVSSQRVNGGFAPGVGLRPQATGALGAANPFRATMFAATSAPSAVGGMSHTFVTSASTPSSGRLNKTGGIPFLSPGNVAFTPSFTHLGQDSSGMQQSNPGASLI